MIRTRELREDVTEALRSRGHSDEEIRHMTMLRIMEEYAAWEIGDSGWGRAFHSIVESFQHD